jgi:integrase
MNQMTPQFHINSRLAFAHFVGLSLHDVRANVAALPATVRRRDTLSALDAVPKLFGRDLTAVPAEWIALRALFSGQNAVQLGVSEKRFANIRSEITKAVKTYGAGCPALTKRLPLTPAWQALLASIHQLSYGQGLRRLACFCSVTGIHPTQVCSQTLLGFHEALVAEEVVKNPRRILKHTIAVWNMCGRQVPGWPAIKLASPFEKKQFMQELEVFPKSFRADIAKWRKRLLEVDIMEDDGPSQTLRPITVDCEEKMIRRFASALILDGHIRLKDITSLAALVDLDVLKAGLRHFLQKANNTPTNYVRKYAWLFLSIARHHCKLPETDIKKIRGLGLKLGKRELGMTQGNRNRLTQFEKSENIIKMLTFPMAERARGLKAKNPYRRAKFFERALSAAILIYASVRMQNLRTIRLDQNIRYQKGCCILSFAKTEMKNGRPLELELPAQVTALLREFVKDHRGQFPGSDGPYLFPSKNGGPRSHNTMRHDFETAVLKHTGLVVNPHFMRHLTAMIAIDQDPANLPAVAQRLGHAGLQTAINFYLGSESKPSSRVINKILEEAILNPKSWR